jgi:beta-lactam-binding protein with PASTA domain
VLLDGRYRVDAVLARGGMSTVYQGLDTRLDRPVAIKMMDPRFAGDPSFLERFIREARATARLRHPSVVAVHDQGVDRSQSEDQVFLVMELVDGGTLRDLLRAHRALPVPLALAVLEPVLSALAAAHRVGLVHRDIKPANVLIGRGGEVKVADFGLVRAVAEAGTTSSSVILGTVAYLSPEQVATGSADARSDVYSAGVVLFEMLTGHPPFTGDTALSVAYRHVNDDVPAPSAAVPGVPEAVDQLVLRATRRDPRDRPVDAAAFLQAVQRVRAQLEVPRVQVRPPGVPGADDDAPTQPARPLPPGPQHPGPRGTRALTRAAARPPLAAHPQAGPVPGGQRGPGQPPGQHVRQPGPAGQPQRGQDAPPNPYVMQRTRDRRVFLIWLVVVALVTAMVGYGAWHLAVGRWTVVPSLDSLDRGGIELALRHAGLDPRVVNDHHDMVPAGVVVSISPATGSRVLRGRDVTVVLSQGRPRVPDITPGTTVEAASADLANADLQLRRDEHADAYDEKVAEGAVLRLAPPPGTELTVGAQVTVVLSKGAKPVAVPDLRGRSVDEAVAALRGAGLVASGEPTRRFDHDVAGGKVIGTEPGAGKQAPRGSAVVLVVSTALTVPDVLGLPRPQALQALRDAGFDPMETGDGAGNDGARAYGTNPGAGSLVDPANNRIVVEISTTAPVPLVIGKTVGDAKALLAKYGLQVQVSQLVPSDSSAVVGQSPGPGTRVAPGSVVVLTAFP